MLPKITKKKWSNRSTAFYQHTKIDWCLKLNKYGLFTSITKIDQKYYK